MSHSLLIVLSVIDAAFLIAVLAIALKRIQIRLTRIGEGLGTLGNALAGVESGHLRPLGQCIKDINAKLEVILGALPGIAQKAAIVASRRVR